MAIENQTQPGEPEPDDSRIATITPLSLFFPEITDEEARVLDGETALIMERRTRVMDMYRRKWSMDQIRKELGCSLGTVHRDIHIVLEGYKRIGARAAHEHLADMLQQLARREIDIEIEWEKSKGEQTETYTGRRDGKSASSDARVKRTQRYGDPRLATLLLGIIDRRCRLFGLLKTEDFKHMAGTRTQTKLVKGVVDPVEDV